MKISKLLIVVLVAAFSLGLSVEPNTPAVRAGVVTAQASNGATVTKIRINGRFAEADLTAAGGVDGALTASHDQVTNTSGLDFSYAYPDPTNPDQVILIQGAGPIPNGAITLTSTSAHLAYTTTSSFLVNRCILNIVTGAFHCDPGTPKTFDLTWAKNGFGTVAEKTTRRETRGPVTTRFQGELTEATADLNGTFDGRTPFGGVPGGNLVDTRSTTIIREITVEPNP